MDCIYMVFFLTESAVQFASYLPIHTHSHCNVRLWVARKCIFISHKLALRLMEDLLYLHSHSLPYCIKVHRMWFSYYNIRMQYL